MGASDPAAGCLGRGFEPLPEATYWFEQDGEIVCSTTYKHSILWLRTMDPEHRGQVPTLQDFISETEPEP